MTGGRLRNEPPSVRSEAPTQVLQEPQEPAGNGAPPKLADGIELVGKYEGSGYREEPFIVRRADGQMLQLPELLYLVAEEANGSAGYEQIAARVSERFGRDLGPDDVRMLVEEKLRPIGVFAAADGSSPQLEKPDPMLGLKLKFAIVPAGAVRALTTLFKPLFFPGIVLAVIAGLVALDVWLFFVHGVAGSLRSVIYQPILVVLILGLITLSAAFHEIGHASALRYGGGKPGAMGAGIYIVWPAFYTDVTDAYRLDRTARLRTDLGGLYFNAIFMLATAGAYFATGYEPLLLLIPVQHLQMLFQLLPLIRLDGYYLISDLTGVPDLFARIGPTLRSLLPWRNSEKAVTDLKWWARGVVTLYVLVTVPLLLGVVGLLLLNLPRMLATGWDSFFVQLDRVRDDSSTGSRAIGGLQMGILVLPAIGLAVTGSRIGRMVGGSLWTRTDERPIARSALVLCTGAAAALLAYTWWPNGEYRPIQPGERGTVLGGIEQLRHVSSGRPSLAPERQEELGGAPTRRDSETPPPVDSDDETPADTTPASTATTPTTTEPVPTTTEPSATEPTETFESPETTTTETVPAETTTTTETTTTETTTTETTTTTTTDTTTTTTTEAIP